MRRWLARRLRALARRSDSTATWVERGFRGPPSGAELLKELDRYRVLPLGEMRRPATSKPGPK